MKETMKQLAVASYKVELTLEEWEGVSIHDTNKLIAVCDELSQYVTKVRALASKLAEQRQNQQDKY